MLELLTFAMVACLFADLAVEKAGVVYAWVKDQTGKL